MQGSASYSLKFLTKSDARRQKFVVFLYSDTLAEKISCNTVLLFHSLLSVNIGLAFIGDARHSVPLRCSHNGDTELATDH